MTSSAGSSATYYEAMDSPTRSTCKEKCALYLLLVLINVLVHSLIYSLTPEKIRLKRMLLEDESAWGRQFESELVPQTWRTKDNISDGFLKASVARYTNMSKPHVLSR